MPGVIATLPKLQFATLTGAPLAGGTLDVYLAGTTTRTTTWQDSSLSSANTNPVVLDSRGACVVWLDSTKRYKLVLKNAAGVSQWTQDNIIGGGVSGAIELSAASIEAARTEAAASAAAALTTRTAIDNRYRGALAADPATRTDGSANQLGDEYFNSATSRKMVFRATGWLDFELNSSNSAAASEASRQVAVTQAGISTTQAGLATTAKTAAEAARDAANVNGKIYATTAAGLAAVASGAYFSTPSAASAEHLILYLNSAGVAVEQKRYPSAKLLEPFAKYTGSGPMFPLAVDSQNNTIFGFNSGTGELFGLGLVAESAFAGKATVAVNARLGETQQADYKGSGPVTPLVTDQSNRIVLGFDESTQMLVGPGLGASVNGALMPIHKAINHLLFYGQSLSLGAQGTPLLSTTQPYSNVTFSGGPRAWTGSGNDFTAFKPLVEDAVNPAPDGNVGRGETPCSGAANYASTLAAVDNGVSPASHVILASTAGRGGYRIDQLNKGTVWYERLTLHISSAKALNADYALHAFAWLQGEDDAIAGVQTPYATYRARLAQLQADVEADAVAISGQKSSVFCLTYQMSYAARTWPDQAKAQLDLAQKQAKFVLATPTYHLPHAADNVHLTAVGYKWIGAYFGRAYKQLVLDGKKMQWLNPLSATRRGAVIRVRYAVPTLPLVLDTTTLAATTDKGFKVLDGASTATISAIAVDGPDVVITLAAAPVGVVKVRYALDYLGAGLTIENGASGNLRDSTPDTYLIGGLTRPLYHVAPHAELTAITLGE